MITRDDIKKIAKGWGILLVFAACMGFLIWLLDVLPVGIIYGLMGIVFFIWVSLLILWSYEL